MNPAGGLAAWTIALDGYLTRLRAAWGEQPEHELRALLAGVGVAADPSDAERLAFDRAAAGPPDRISAGLQLTSGETLTIAAVWAAETDPQFAVVLGCAHDDPARRYASAALLRLLAQPYGLDLPTAWTSADPLVRSGVLLPTSGPWGPLVFTPTARALLAGHWRTDQADRPAIPERLAGLPDRLAAHIDGSGPVLLRGAGAAALARAVVLAAGRVPLTDPMPVPELRLLARLKLGVPVRPAADLPVGWVDGDGPWLAYGELGETVDGAQPVDVPQLNAAQRTAAWREQLAGAGLSTGELADRLADRFRYPEEAIAAVVAHAVTAARWAGRAPTADDVWTAAQHPPSPAPHRPATPLDPVYTRDGFWPPPKGSR